jgi:hypothetical protein
LFSYRVYLFDHQPFVAAITIKTNGPGAKGQEKKYSPKTSIGSHRLAVASFNWFRQVAGGLQLKLDPLSALA